MPHFARILFLVVITVSLSFQTQARDWSKGAEVPPQGRSNPFELGLDEFLKAQEKGREHALYYPVTKTGILLPLKPIQNLVNGESKNPLKVFISRVLGVLSPFKSFDEMQEWLGLLEFPEESNYPLPKKKNFLPDHRMGMTYMETENGMGFTLSCAQCHSSELFGQKILGLSNRFPRANDFFNKGIRVTPMVSERMFSWATSASPGERKMFEKVKGTVPFIAAKKPTQLGLDTSLAQVALSLSKRAQDPYASKIPTKKRANLLDHYVADSKPMVWWNVKYKNRWLSDGSVISGNPIFTNIIWNEIGRGADLKEIEEWLGENSQMIKELTTAVFSSEAPHITDFFEPQVIDELQAQKGEILFNQTCAKCHGTYTKNWSLPHAHQLSSADRLKTFEVIYPKKTFVVDVGTDPGRHQGMKALAVLNDLSISKTNNIVIEPQKGYVPPPLVGIWARWPYFHNNSAPSLCAVLTRGALRPKSYWARAPIDPEKDFDLECNGYPEVALNTELPWENYYDTRREGLSRFGHDQGIFIIEGKEIFSSTQKKQLIQFLQTL